jgi:hypothetical protein
LPNFLPYDTNRIENDASNKSRLFWLHYSCFKESEEINRHTDSNVIPYASFDFIQIKEVGQLDLRKIRWGGMDWIYLAQDRDQ